MIGKVFLRYTKGAKHISGWSRRNWHQLQVFSDQSSSSSHWWWWLLNQSLGIESCTWLLFKNLSCENISLHFKAASIVKPFQFKKFICFPLLASILNYVSSPSVSWYPSIFALWILVCLLCLKYANAFAASGPLHLLCSLHWSIFLHTVPLFLLRRLSLNSF